MFSHLRPAILAMAIFSVMLGLAYPLAETGIGQAFLGHQANGSLTANGSTRIGQQWSGPQWFQGRADGDDPTATGGTNLGPRSQKLLDEYHKRVADLQQRGDAVTQGLVTSSGSGVDPDITPQDAYAQAPRVAEARGLPLERVRALIAGHVSGPQYGFLGAEHVNVLQLNEALAALR